MDCDSGDYLKGLGGSLFLDFTLMNFILFVYIYYIYYAMG